MQDFKTRILIVDEKSLNKVKSHTWVKGWSEAAKKQLEQKLKSFKLAEEAPYKSISVHFDDGSSAIVLTLPVKASSYDIQTSLKPLGKSIKADLGDKVAIDTTLAPKNSERNLVSWLSSLSVLEAWDYPKQTKKKTTESKKASTEIKFFSKLKPKDLQAAVKSGADLADSNNLVRTLAETSANLLKPDTYRKLVEKRAKEIGYQTEFLGIEKLKKLEAGSFLSVTKADPDDLGGILKLKYKPKSAKKSLALVGKGMCFDTGGYNIKTGNHMFGMHRDMTGSAVALATFEYLVKQKVNFEVTAYLALAENLISPHASRPNDLVFAANGTSIEIVDTDAEGRLVLADTLVVASEQKPDLILDFATLTGSAVRSLDTRISAVFSNDDGWLKKAVEIGALSGERTWGFPIGGDYWKKLKSDVADIKQCNTAPNADHIYAATFLSHFVGKDIPWVHMDLNTDTNAGGLGLVGTETTGFGVRWAATLIENHF